MYKLRAFGRFPRTTRCRSHNFWYSIYRKLTFAPLLSLVKESSPTDSYRPGPTIAARYLNSKWPGSFPPASTGLDDSCHQPVISEALHLCHSMGGFQHWRGTLLTALGWALVQYFWLHRFISSYPSTCTCLCLKSLTKSELFRSQATSYREWASSISSPCARRTPGKFLNSWYPRRTIVSLLRRNGPASDGWQRYLHPSMYGCRGRGTPRKSSQVSHVARAMGLNNAQTHKGNNVCNLQPFCEVRSVILPLFPPLTDSFMRKQWIMDWWFNWRFAKKTEKEMEKSACFMPVKYVCRVASRWHQAPFH